MLRRWELASASWSSVAELNRSNSLQSNERYNPHNHGPSSRLTTMHQLPPRGHVNYKSLPSPIVNSSKDRPENRARFDGLQDVSYHCPSPNTMPRHVLEPISQSPTQSLRAPGQMQSVVNSSRYGNGYSQYTMSRHESPGALIRNSPTNPYVHQFQIQSRNRVT